MDKSKDIHIYLDLHRRLRFQNHPLEKRRVAHARILKLSKPKADDAYLMIGKLLNSSGEFQKCLFPLKKATIINPKNTIAQILLANSFLKLGKENEGFLTIQKALLISPREPALHSSIIKILKERNQFGDLLSFYQKTADMIKDNKSVLFELYFHSAETFENLKMFPQALEHYQKASETHAMRSEHYTKYAHALINNGLPEEAIVQFEHLLKLNPTNALGINNIASLYYELGRIDKAFEVIEHIMKDGLQTNTTYLNLILVLEDLDKDEEVIKKYRDRVQRYIERNREEMQLEYLIELLITEKKLESDINERTREFYTKKLKVLNMASSLLNT